MKLLLAVIRYEWMLQLRSARFRLAAAGYLALCSLPPALMYFVLRHRTTEVLGSNAYLAQLAQVQPYLTLLLVALIAGNRSGASALEQSWAVLAASPMSNAGYLLRRVLALLILILPLTLVPFAITLLLSQLAGNRGFDWVTWFGHWGLGILPLAVFFACYWLAWVTVTGSELAALIFSFAALPLAVSSANQILLKFHLTLSDYLEGLGLRPLYHWIAWTLQALGSSHSRFHPGYAATEAPFDLSSAAAWSLPHWALLGGLAALGLGLAAAFLRRTRRDLKPRPVPRTHQLRTFLEKLNHWRERYAADGGLGRSEGLAVLAGVAVLGLVLAALLGRQSDIRSLAGERYRAEMNVEFEPLPADVQPVTWRLRGRIEPSGRLAINASGRFENRGSAALEALAFALDPELEIESLESPGRRVEIARDWDRLQLRLAPVLGAGETLELSLRLAGVPAEVSFNLGRRFPFPRRYERLLHARFPRDVSDLSLSWVRRAASPRRVMLRASDLGPVPRYASWKLTEPGESRGEGYEVSDYGREVPVESARIPVDLEIDLEVPADWFLADTCGHVSRPAKGRMQLSGSCHTSWAQLAVAGGRLVPFQRESGESEDRVIIATLPQHREQVERKLGSLSQVASLSERAWPGMPGLEDLVALEWPPEFHLDPRHGMSRWGPRLEPILAGRLLLIPERMLVDGEPFESEDLVARLLSRDLIDRRELASEQELVFRSLFRALMIRRMGLDGEAGATVTGKPWHRQVLKTPILSVGQKYGYGAGSVLRQRLPAVLVEIESRVGGDNLYTAIETFLSVSGQEPGTIEELLATIADRGGISLEQTYQDHFLGEASPLLRLEDVEARRRDGGWEVEGRVRNTGTGQSICPLVIKTEISEQVLTVTVESESATVFTARLERRPHTVLLDPERTCYRWLLKTSSALERANLLG